MGLMDKINQARFRLANRLSESTSHSEQKRVNHHHNREGSTEPNRTTQALDDGAQKASSVAPMVAYSTLGRPVWTPRNYEALARNGYKKNVIVYRCVNLIARSLSSMKWILYEGEHEVINHPVLRLLNRPHPHTSGAAFMESLVGSLMLSGNAYVEMVDDGDGDCPGPFAELHTLRPDRIRVIPGASGLVSAYEYTVDGHKKLIHAEHRDASSPIMHFKLFNPLNDWYGMSPIEAAGCSIDQHNTVASHNLSILQNGGRPSGALMVDTKARGYEYSNEELDQLRQDLRKACEGHDNAGRIIMLQGDFVWHEMGLSPKDLDFIEGKLLSAREIAQAFNVPSMLVGVPGDSTFANFKEARYHLWEDTLLPLMDMIVDGLNNWLISKYAQNLRLSYDRDSIPALSAKRDEVWARLANADFLTPNEKREALGYSPLSNEEGSHV